MSKLEPIWQHLPFHFKQNVVSNLDFKSRCQLQICSKEEQSLVDSRQATIDFLALELTEPTLDDPRKEFPADINIRDKGVSTSRNFTEDDAIRQILNICGNNQKWKVMTLRIHVWNYNRGGLHFKFFKKFLAEINRRNIKLNVSHFEFPTTLHKKQHVNFVKTVNVDFLQTMSFDRVTDCSLTALFETDQWKKVKELKFTTIYEIKADWVLHVEKLDIRIKHLNGDTAGALIENFLTKNFPRGSFMSIATYYPLHLQNILENFPVTARNENFDLKSITDSPIKTHFQEPLHTQRIRIRDRRNDIFIIICERCLAVIVCSVDEFEKDLIKFIQK